VETRDDIGGKKSLHPFLSILFLPADVLAVYTSVPVTSFALSSGEIERRFVRKSGVRFSPEHKYKFYSMGRATLLH
jgi:hypothetical protein